MSRDMQGFTDGPAAIDETRSSEDQDRQKARNTIAMGMDFSVFLNGDVGQYLDVRAAQEIAALRAQVDEIDPTDSKAIRDLQQDIAVRKVWKDWIMAVVQEGQAAEALAIDRNEI